MTDTMVSLQRKIDNAKDLGGVVRTMKAIAASNIGQVEQSVRALAEYTQRVELGLGVCLRQELAARPISIRQRGSKPQWVTAVVFGSDQGLVGRFNDLVSHYAVEQFKHVAGTVAVWAVGDRVAACLRDAGIQPVGVFPVPTSVTAITPLVDEIQIETQQWGAHRQDDRRVFWAFLNRFDGGLAYEPTTIRILPLDESWQKEVAAVGWPTKVLPEVIGSGHTTLRALIREFLFVSLFQAAAESLASENRSRLLAMERAERNIEELVENLSLRFHRLRQNKIDEELFDVVSGYEALGADRDGVSFLPLPKSPRVG